MNSNPSILERYLAKTPRSAALADIARTVLPGGIVTDTRHFEPYGVYIDRASGSLKWDVDGHEYLDFFGGHGANMLGHSPPVMVNAVQRAIARGVQYAANQPLEIALAQTVLRHFSLAQRVRFTGSGTEATLLALRLARAYTGRAKIVRFAGHYHGWHDHAVSGYAAQFDGSAAPGVLPEIAAQTLLLPPGDERALEQATENYGAQIAAFIIEPIGSHFGVVPVSAHFLRLVQAAAAAAGALFILDEVLSGFRVALGGAQFVYGLRPDLTTLAKILCGGLPGGAVVGRAEIMDLLDFDAVRRGGREKVLHQGTFTGNPISMAAGLAVLGEIERIDACSHANDLGASTRNQLNAMAEAEHLPLRWYGEFSAFHMLFCDPENACSGIERTPTDFRHRPQLPMNRFRMALNVLGMDVNTKGSGLLSAVHTDKDVDRYVAAVADSAAMLRREGLI